MNEVTVIQDGPEDIATRLLDLNEALGDTVYRELSTRGPRVALAYVHPGWVYHGFMESVLQWQKDEFEPLRVAIRSGPNISRARNTVVSWFLESNADYLFFVDADMVFDRDVPSRLLAYDVPIVSALCHGQNEDGTTFVAASDFDENNTLQRITEDKLDGLTPVAACGTACLLIQREVLEKLGTSPLYPFSDEDWGSPIGVTGHDITFGLRARYMGFFSYVAADVRVLHTKEHLI